ncbi:TetR/AcrR family transcriptional regulator [Amycolatopsis sp. FDAARGOS 1241]|uniref:TetR/AcrR family transcriptional regulator n=1 Tax=Amycolatopsis sp. FDAARGOS 1241 TaxID=2778070 RepID=UPI0019502C5B|nr:TetR/AcrR family transcriptional regulator [Amycolatopsis sp. FDAARGOS 1241]QRP47398.1 TetR family transcriptional regulator [Amycolatopsis sp. FDAARGOS 1241]
MTDTPRRRDAGRTRAALLKAAAELFAERGFAQATIRDIGERAGVDSAMIARYFGGKAQLYVAVLHEEQGAEDPPDLLDTDRLRELVGRAVRQGPGPLYHAALHPHDDPQADEYSRTELHRRIVTPLAGRLRADAVDRPQARAELLTAAVVGVLIGRSSGALPALTALDADTLTSLLTQVLSSME